MRTIPNRFFFCSASIDRPSGSGFRGCATDDRENIAADAMKAERAIRSGGKRGHAPPENWIPHSVANLMNDDSILAEGSVRPEAEEQCPGRDRNGSTGRPAPGRSYLALLTCWRRERSARVEKGRSPTRARSLGSLALLRDDKNQREPFWARLKPRPFKHHGRTPCSPTGAARGRGQYDRLICCQTAMPAITRMSTPDKAPRMRTYGVTFFIRS